MAKKNSKKYSNKVLLHENSKDNATINAMATTKVSEEVQEVQETFVSAVDDIKEQVVSYLSCFCSYLSPCSCSYSY